MKVFILVVAVSFLVAAKAATFSLSGCIRVEIDSNLTITAQSGKEKVSREVNLGKEAHTVNGSCGESNTTVRSMTITYSGEADSLEWILTFSVNKDNIVILDQNVHFVPSVLLNSSLTNDTVSLTDAENTALSLRNLSYECMAETDNPFTPVMGKDKYNYTVSQVMKNLRVQAFDLVNDTFSDAVHCDADKTSSEAPTTTPPTTTPVTPAPKGTYVVKDSKGVVCFRLEAGLQFVVEYNNTKNAMVLSKTMTIPKDAKVEGTCANGSIPAVMKISGSDFVLEITETEKDAKASSSVKLNVTLDKTHFPDAAVENETLEFEGAAQSFQTASDTFYVCQSEQKVNFSDTRTVLYTNDVRLQAFGLKKGNFTGNGVRCSLDPTPAPPTTPTTPTTPTPSPDENTYYVNGTNSTCIVLKADISFTITYNTTKNQTKTTNPIAIPLINGTTGNVGFSGNCFLEGGNTQQLQITFNGNWTLTFNFTLGTGSKASALLRASKEEFYVRDIQLKYVLQPEFFPDAQHPNEVVTVSHSNMTNDLWKAAESGSYRCDADIKQNIGNGVQMDTKKLQYKAFSKDFNMGFPSDNVSECPSDDESNSVVPIAVGAALAGLVVIVLIAYLIGRRRSRREGYESV